MAWPPIYPLPHTQISDTSGAAILSVPHQRGRAPEILYYADRKGWAVDHFRALGARYVVIADHRVIPGDLRRYFARYNLWQWERVLIVRL